jgi:membrane protease subunit HflK
VSVGFELAAEATGTQSDPRISQFLTGDQNIVNIHLVVQYCVEDPVKYLFGAQDVQRVVVAAAERALTHNVQQVGVDSVLVEGRTELQEAVRKEAMMLLSCYDVGVRLVNVSIKTAFPPAEVSDAFKAVASARGDRDRIIDEARGYMNEVVQKAEGEATALIRQAQAERRRMVAEAEGDTARFRKVYAEYRKAPKVMRKRVYLEALEKVVPKMKLIVSDSSHGARPLDLGILSSVAPTEKKPAGP